jgi:putative restriction endonuclease
MQENLEKYLKTFDSLRIDKAHGIAPHKPILLLSILQTFQNNNSNSKRIYISPELVALFKTNWNLLVTSNHDCRFALPFNHLTSDKFWKLIPKPGFENILKLSSSMRSFANLNAAVEYAQIDEDLFFLMKDKKSNEILQHFLLNKYFNETKKNYDQSNYLQQKLFDSIENKILNESPDEYMKEIKELLINKNDEEVFLRGSLFKREIPRIYNNRCAISGMRIDSTLSVSMIDACHIIPWSFSNNDSVTNGIALCPNLHRAFDRGLIAIDENYKVLVSKSFKEELSSYSIKCFENEEINLPSHKNYFPNINNFNWHFENIFKR